MIDPLFMAKALRDNEDELLRAGGFEKNKHGEIYDPLHPSKTICLTPKDIIAKSLKIEPYRTRPLPDKIQLVASYKRTHESLIEERKIVFTFTPSIFLKSLPPAYLYIGSSNSAKQIQVLRAEAVKTGESFKNIRGLRLKESQFELNLLLRIIEREIVDETCIVERPSLH